MKFDATDLEKNFAILQASSTTLVLNALGRYTDMIEEQTRIIDRLEKENEELKKGQSEPKLSSK